MFVDDIRGLKYAKPLFLHMILDVLEQNPNVTFKERVLQTTEPWSVIHCPMQGGYLTLRADRARRQISVAMYPHIPEVGDVLRDLLISGYQGGLAGR